MVLLYFVLCVVGAIASAVVYGALMGATPEQIEAAVGMVVAHYIPFRAIRAGHQLSDSKGASAAISTEVAILCVRRAMHGFVGPKDIFRNPEAIFRHFQPTKNGDSPFEIVLSHSGADFAVMGMHFKLGLYEHQSAGALQGLIDVLRANPNLAAASASASAAASASDADTTGWSVLLVFFGLALPVLCFCCWRSQSRSLAVLQ